VSSCCQSPLSRATAMISTKLTRQGRDPETVISRGPLRRSRWRRAPTSLAASSGSRMPGMRAALVLAGQVIPDGLVAPELDFDIGVRGPGGPRLVPAVPARRIRHADLLNQAGQFAEEEHAPVAGPG
jgi:hypothetical protein